MSACRIVASFATNICSHRPGIRCHSHSEIINGTIRPHSARGESIMRRKLLIVATVAVLVAAAIVAAASAIGAGTAVARRRLERLGVQRRVRLLVLDRRR